VQHSLPQWVARVKACIAGPFFLIKLTESARVVTCAVGLGRKCCGFPLHRVDDGVATDFMFDVATCFDEFTEILTLADGAGCVKAGASDPLVYVLTVSVGSVHVTCVRVRVTEASEVSLVPLASMSEGGGQGVEAGDEEWEDFMAGPDTDDDSAFSVVSDMEADAEAACEEEVEVAGLLLGGRCGHRRRGTWST
jgi:hypothetical protein